MSASITSAHVAMLFPEGEQDMARRRGQRTGYVYRRGDSWFGQFRIDTPELDDGGHFKRKTLTKFIAPAAGPGKVLKKRAMQMFYDAHLKDLHKTGPLSCKTLREFVEEQFKPQVVCRCKPSGQAHYKYMLDLHVVPALGDFLMRDVRAQHVYNLIKGKLEKKLSIQTVTHIRNTVSAIFRHAKRLQAHAGDSPTEGVKLPELVHKERRALTLEQVRLLGAWIGRTERKALKKRGHRMLKPEDLEAINTQLGALITILVRTGLRIGEAMGLRWKSVNLTEKSMLSAGEMVKPRSLMVRENFVRGEYGSVKTRRSRRDVPLDSEAITAFGKLSPGGPDDPVFVSRNGTPLDQHNVASRYLRPAGEKAGCPWVSWHVLRHTWATWADQAGLSVADRQLVLGHTTDAMAMHYTHSDLESVRGRMEKIGKETVN